MRRDNLNRPKAGVIGIAFPGCNLGEEMCADKTREMLEVLKEKNEIEVVYAKDTALTEEEVSAAADQLQEQNVDVIVTLLCTFVPDYYIVKLLEHCDKPVFLWAVEREMKCISLVGACLVTGTLYNLDKKYELCACDIYDKEAMEKLLVFARAAMLKRICSRAAVGVSGGKNNIMMSMQWDEYAIRRAFGINLKNIPIEELYRISEELSDEEIRQEWKAVQKECGRVEVRDEDGLLAVRLYMAAKKIIERENLSGYSINCFPALKSKICLAVARLNDELLAAGCEGDLNSTILMLLLEQLSGKAAFNGDFLRLYREDNSILFSHCGAGAFSLAEKREEVRLNASIETCDGCAVCYPTYARGDYTLINLMTGKDGLRMAVMSGEAVETDLAYEGTPLRVRFDKNIDEILHNCCKYGSGHHWSGAQGDYTKELELFCRWSRIEFHMMS